MHVKRMAVTVMMALAATAARAETDRTFPQGRATCHARVYDAAHLASHPKQRVVAISLSRVGRDLAAEKQFIADGEITEDMISATLRVRLRGDPVTHVAKLECDGTRNGERTCETPACQGGEITVAPATGGAIRIGVGGRLKSGRFVAHFLHLDDSCESDHVLVLESGDDDHEFRLPAAPAEACK
jgi:cytochrome c5